MPSPSFSWRQSMRCRSESVKRTVVDLSFSFFITVNYCNRAIGLSLRKSSQGKRVDSKTISPRYRPAKHFSEHCIAIRKVMYKVPVQSTRCPKEHTSPIRSSSLQARRGRAAQSRFMSYPASRRPQKDATFLHVQSGFSWSMIVRNFGDSSVRR